MSEEKKISLEDMDNADRDIFGKRISVDLTPKNAFFKESEGGLISMTLKKGDKEEFFERVVPVRAFPVSEPDSFISIREPDTKDVGKGAEIGLIENLNDFDENSVSLIKKELDKRYFTPIIQKIYSIKEQFGFLYFEVLTSAGKSSFVMNNPEISKMDKASFKKIEIYL